MNERGIQLALWRELSHGSQLVCPNFTPSNWWECDVWSLSKSGYWSEHEIKLTASDFKADSRKECLGNGVFDRHTRIYTPLPSRNKHELLATGYREGPSRFWYVMPERLLDKVVVPDWAGIRSARPYGCDVRLQIIRMAPKLHGLKCDAQMVEKVRAAFYWRFWSSLQKLHDARQRPKQAESNAF